MEVTTETKQQQGAPVGVDALVRRLKPWFKRFEDHINSVQHKDDVSSLTLSIEDVAGLMDLIEDVVFKFHNI